MAGIAATYINQSEFSIVGNRVSEFNFGRRIQANCGVDGERYGTILDSTSVAGITIVSLRDDSDLLTANLIEVYYGIVRVGESGSLGDHTHDGTPGSGGPIGYPTTLVHVEKAGSDITGVGSPINPFLTIGHALSTVTTATQFNRFTIRVGPGIYNEDPLVTKENVDIISSSGVYNTSIVATDSTSPLIYYAGRASLEGFTLVGLGQTHDGIVQNSSGAGLINNVGFSNFDRALKIERGSLVASTIVSIAIPFTSINVFVECVSGLGDITIINNPIITLGSIFNTGFRSSGSGAFLQLTEAIVQGSGTTCVHADNGSNMQIFGVACATSLNGLRVSNSSQLDVVSPYMQQVTNHIVVDDLPSVINIQAGKLNKEKFNFPDGYANDIFSAYNDEEYDLTGFTGNLNVGRSDRGSSVYIGEGNSYTRGMQVLTTDDSATSTFDGTNFINVTDILTTDSTATVSFQGLTAGYAMLIGTTLKGLDSDYLKLPGFHYNISDGFASATEKPFVIEYWDGSTWSWLEYFVYSDEEVVGYGNNLFLTENGDYFARVRPSNNMVKTIDGVEARWYRIRIINDLTTLPVLNRMSLVPSSTHINTKGFMTFEGEALQQKTIFEATRFGEIGGVGTRSFAVGSGTPYTGWTQQAFYSIDNPGDGLQFQFSLPVGICTSCPITAKVNFIVTPSGASSDGTMVLSLLPVEVANNHVADPTGGNVLTHRSAANTELVTSKAAQYREFSIDLTTSNKMQTIITDVGFDIDNYYPGDFVFGQLYLSDGGDGAKDISIYSIEIQGVVWILGDKIVY